MWKGSVNIRDEFHFLYECNGSRAKLTWRPKSVTYIAQDPLRSYLDERQKKEIYFLNNMVNVHDNTHLGDNSI